MPAGLSTALIGFGAVLTSVNDVVGCAVAGLGVLFELVIFSWAPTS